jgi:hypothetical protein
MSAVNWLSGHPSVRQAAVALLEQIGAPTSVELLLDANVGIIRNINYNIIASNQQFRCSKCQATTRVSIHTAAAAAGGVA